MYRLVRLYLKWKFLVVVVFALCVVVLFGIDNPLLGIGAVLFVTFALAIVYLLIRYANAVS